MLNEKNKEYWQNYKPGEVPSPSNEPPPVLLKDIKGRVLDIGTGDGVLAEKLAEKGFSVFGIDIAENIICENKKRNTKVEYSVQDITKRTNFPDNYFNLILFKYTLTNIHKESWEFLGEEIFRILEPHGKVWIFEPLVSEMYKERYSLASYFVEDKNCVYVFSEKSLAQKIESRSDLERAIEENKVSRIIKHYQEEELNLIFAKLKLVQSRKTQITSPSGFEIRTFEGIFSKE
jgi:ubiquinone/menaquinone biosynthesis C-methylase UbiE